MQKDSYMYSRKKISLLILWGVILSLFLFPFSSVYAKNDNNSVSLNLYAKSAVLMDADSGRVLYEKNGSQVMPMASTTKIMTCILALENGNLEDYAEVSPYASSMPKVHLGARSGEYFKLNDLLYSLMLESHNDSAVIIAEKISGSTEAFASLMNKKAREIGCTDTCFITPNGLDAVATSSSSNQTMIHSTTATDLARIMSYCIMESPMREAFLKITRTPNYSFTSYKQSDGTFTATGKSYSCNNHNAFLNMMEGALSGKTGFTGNAGYCYVGALRQGERTFVVALLACGWPNNKTYKWSDTRQLMNYGLTHYNSHGLKEYLYKEEDLPQIPVYHCQTNQLGALSFETPYIDRNEHIDEQKILLSDEETFQVSLKMEEQLDAPVTAGQKVGELSYYLNDELYYTESILVPDELKKIDFPYCLRQTLQHFIFC